MKVWIDLANSPHVRLVEPIVQRLREGGHEVLLSARAHAQTVELARQRWPDVRVVGGESPGGLARKARAIAVRAEALRRVAREECPTVAFSHGSYAQLLAARAARVPAVTMMDYEHQPANHLSFRLARRVIVPEIFPERELRRQGGRAAKVSRYPGFKEELYLARLRPDPSVLDELGLAPERVIAVFRPPPEGALYHRMENRRFLDVLDHVRRQPGAQVVVLPRSLEQALLYRSIPSVVVPEHAVDASSLLALADATFGGGGTMTRESAILGTPTYTVFAGALAAADAALIADGRLVDLRTMKRPPVLEKKVVASASPDAERAKPILECVLAAIDDVARRLR